MNKVHYINIAFTLALIVTVISIKFLHSRKPPKPSDISEPRRNTFFLDWRSKTLYSSDLDFGSKTLYSSDGSATTPLLLQQAEKEGE